MNESAPRRKQQTRKTLRELYAEHEGKVSDKWSIYLDIYENAFSAFRNKPVRLLEIGVQNGGSLEIWRKYFPNAERIVGCDVNEKCRELTFDDGNISLIIGDANSDQAEKGIVTQSDRYDIIIDDGSHQSSDIIRSFSRYFQYLNDGGKYVAEDLHCSYWQRFGGGLYNPYSAISFFKRLLDVINSEHWGLPSERKAVLSAFEKKYLVSFEETLLASIHSVEFANSLCIIQKGAPKENELGSRKVAGRRAIVVEELMQADGRKSVPKDETRNPWGLSSMTQEEEIETNRGLISSQSAELAERKRRIDQLEREKRQLEIRLHERFGEIATLTRLLRAREEENLWLRWVAGALVGDSPRGRLVGFLPGPLAYALRKIQLKRRRLFDGRAYLRANPDVAESGADPLRHYLCHGLQEGRSRG